VSAFDARVSPRDSCLETASPEPGRREAGQTVSHEREGAQKPAGANEANPPPLVLPGPGRECIFSTSSGSREGTQPSPPVCECGEAKASEGGAGGKEREGEALLLCLLAEVNASLAGALDAETVLGQILARLREKTGLAHASIYLLNSHERLLRCATESGHPTPEPYRPLAYEGPGVVAWVARAAQAVYLPEVQKDPRYLCANPSTQSEYAVPLRVGSNLLGVLDTESDEPDGIGAMMRHAVDQFALPAALAIERSELYKMLRSSEELFRSLFEQGQIGMALCNLQGEFSTVNPAFARMLGYEPEELWGKRHAEVTHPEDRQDSAQRVEQLLRGPTPGRTLEKRYLHKSGEAIWCALTLSLIRDPLGQPVHLLAMIQDMREGKRVEEERARLQAQLFQAQKMEAIGTLAGGIAHDFNNLLGVILGFASIVRLRLSPADPALESIKMIEQSAEHAADLAQQLLGLARQGEQEAAPVRVADILSRVVKIVTRTFDRRIQVQARLGPGSPWVEGELEQAILNLCINARDAMPEGGMLALDTSVVRLTPDDPLRPAHCPSGEYVRVAVQDTGTGIDPRAMERIFDPFFTTKEAGKGSGLGLTMVYGIVSGHGGFVRVESEVGRGSTFTLYLPAARAPGEQYARKKTPQLAHGTGTVLVVDDEPMVLAFAEQGLKKLGYQVLTAEDGKRACEVYRPRAAEIDYVLLDLIMPELSGLETYRRLREVNPQVKVILSSGYSTGEIAREARESGATCFIGKPYTLEALSLALKKAKHT